MLLSEFLVFVLVFIIAYYCTLTYKNDNTLCKLPPGPKGLPFLGNLHQIIKDPHLNFSKWAKEYGKFYTINLVGKPAVVANDMASMKALFGSMASTGQFPSEIFDTCYNGDYGILRSNGQIWQEQKRFVVKTLRHYGFGSGSKIDSVILQECNSLCDLFDTQISSSGTNETVVGNWKRLLMQSTGSFLWTVITGEKIRIGSQNVDNIDHVYNLIEAINQCTNTGLTFFAALKHIAPEMSGFNYLVKTSLDMRKSVRKYFDSHQAPRIPGNEPRDVIDEYLQEMETCKDKNSSFYGNQGWEHSLSSVIVLLMAGSETTGTALNWLLFYLVTNPEVQEKLHQEIDEIIGHDGIPSVYDRHRMPFLEAVIHEVLRHSSIVPFGLIHRLLEPVVVDGYQLPKDTFLIANIYHANFNASVWGDPENFRPERFLEVDEGQRKFLRESIASFQDGKRRCIGEQLAKDMLFLFTARLCQKFKFEMEPGNPKEEYMKPIVGYLLAPPPLGLIVRARWYGK